MARIIADRVRDTWTGTGTGAITLSGTPPIGYRAFSAVGVNTDTFHCLIINQSAPSEWEVTECTFNGTTGLARTTREASSTGAAVSFTAGTKDVIHLVSAAHVLNPDMVVPILGAPASGNLANCTGLPIATGVSGLAANVATFLATPSSANLLAALTTDTGTGNNVFSDSPTFTGTITAAAATFSGLLTPNGQIAFPAVRNASANANTLDDYEESTWTPSLGGTATYTTRVGTYTRIGRLVFINCHIVVNAIGTGSPNTISGLPFAADYYTALACSTWGSAPSSFVFVAGQIAQGTTTIGVTGAAAAVASSANPINVFGSGSNILLSGCYEST